MDSSQPTNHQPNTAYLTAVQAPQPLRTDSSRERERENCSEEKLRSEGRPDAGMRGVAVTPSDALKTSRLRGSQLQANLFESGKEKREKLGPLVCLLRVRHQCQSREQKGARSCAETLTREASAGLLLPGAPTEIPGEEPKNTENYQSCQDRDQNLSGSSGGNGDCALHGGGRVALKGDDVYGTGRFRMCVSRTFRRGSRLLRFVPASFLFSGWKWVPSSRPPAVRPPRLAGGDEDFRFSQSDRGSGPMGCLRGTAILGIDC